MPKPERELKRKKTSFHNNKAKKLITRKSDDEHQQYRRKDQPLDTPKKKSPSTSHQYPNSEISLLGLCDAVSRIVKSLLALGSENNWDDVVQNHGRSFDAARYRENWLYFYKQEKSAESWLKLYQQRKPQKFFTKNPRYDLISSPQYYVENAAAAVSSKTGSCDQHAYVTAMLLQAILPEYMKINICGIKINGKNFPHTFVVVGEINNPQARIDFLNTEQLIVVDAWPTVGGAVYLKDFFLCQNNLDKYSLIVDKTLIADSKDRLIKRVVKQAHLLDIYCNTLEPSSEQGDEPISFDEDRLSWHHLRQEQMEYSTHIKSRALETERDAYGDDMFCAPRVADSYEVPADAPQAWDYILEHYPNQHLKRAIERANEFVTELNKQEPKKPFSRLNSGPYI